MSDTYMPPFTMTEEITNLVIEIGEQVGAVATYDILHPYSIMNLSLFILLQMGM